MLKQQFQAGAISPVEYLRASLGYKDAEIAASSTPQGRLALRREKVEGLKELKAVTESLFEPHA